MRIGVKNYENLTRPAPYYVSYQMQMRANQMRITLTVLIMVVTFSVLTIKLDRE